MGNSIARNKEETKGKLYCNTTNVLQAGSWVEYIAIGRFCIARLEGYCRLGKAVSRYKRNCIVTEAAGQRAWARRWQRGSAGAGRAGVLQVRGACGRSGRRAGGRARCRRGRARSARGRAGWAAGARPGHAAWTPGLALGCALGALGLFSIRFDSFFLPESLNEHCSL